MSISSQSAFEPKNAWKHLHIPIKLVKLDNLNIFWFWFWKSSNVKRRRMAVACVVDLKEPDFIFYVIFSILQKTKVKSAANLGYWSLFGLHGRCWITIRYRYAIAARKMWWYPIFSEWSRMFAENWLREFSFGIAGKRTFGSVSVNGTIWRTNEWLLYAIVQ